MASTAIRKASSGDATIATMDLTAVLNRWRPPARGDAGTDQPAQQRVGRRGRQAQEPRGVPKHRADQRGQRHPNAERNRSGDLRQRIEVDCLGDGVRHRSAHHEGRQEVEDCGEPHRVPGVSDLVAMTVEVALAASWKPFVKSNTIAMAIVTTVASSTPRSYLRRYEGGSKGE